MLVTEAVKAAHLVQVDMVEANVKVGMVETKGTLEVHPRLHISNSIINNSSSIINSKLVLCHNNSSRWYPKLLQVNSKLLWIQPKLQQPSNNTCSITSRLWHIGNSTRMLVVKGLLLLLHLLPKPNSYFNSPNQLVDHDCYLP